MTSVVLAVSATLVCDLISVYAQGSGLPEVKTIFSGINFYKYLSLQTLVAKVFGIVTVQAAGFFIGFQGPMIHISAIIANNLLRIPYFKEFELVTYFELDHLLEKTASHYVCSLWSGLHFWNTIWRNSY